MGIDFTHVNGAARTEMDARDDGRRRRRPRLRRRRQAGPPLRVERLLAGRPSVREPAELARALPQRGQRARTGSRVSGTSTREAGLQRVFYGMGASVADYDGDGRDDVYVTALNRNFLFHNLGGRFEEVSVEGRRPGQRLGNLLGLARLRRRRASPTCTSAATSTGARPTTSSARSTARPSPTARPSAIPGVSSRLYRNAGRRALPRRHQRDGTGNAEPEGARRRAVGLRRRRPGGSARRQRHRAEQPLPQQGRRHVRGRRHPGGRRGRRGRPRARRDGRRLGRHQERPRRGGGDRELLERAQVPLLDGFGRGLPRRVAAERGRPDVASGSDLRRALLRRGPRRTDGPPPRQRPRRADGAGRPEGRGVSPGARLLLERRRRPVLAPRRALRGSVGAARRARRRLCGSRRRRRPGRRPGRERRAGARLHQPDGLPREERPRAARGRGPVQPRRRSAPASPPRSGAARSRSRSPAASPICPPPRRH